MTDDEILASLPPETVRAFVREVGRWRHSYHAALLMRAGLLELFYDNLGAVPTYFRLTLLGVRVMPAACELAEVLGALSTSARIYYARCTAELRQVGDSREGNEVNANGS